MAAANGNVCNIARASALHRRRARLHWLRRRRWRRAACELAIFSEPNFGGTNATADDEQPNCGETGWQNQIASVQVESGTWDFFSDPEFTGETMRLPPGDYADLGPQWTKHAGSFMCVQP